MSGEKLKRQILDLKEELQVKEDVKNLIIRQVEKRAEQAEGRLSKIQNNIQKRIDTLEGYRNTNLHSLYAERFLVVKELRELAVLLKEGLVGEEQ